MRRKTTKVSCHTLTNWAKEEGQSSRMYHRYGFHNIAKDEARHSKLFKHLYDQRCKK